MQVSAHSKRNFYRILPITVIWVFYGLIYAFLEKGILGNLEYYPSTGNPYNFSGQFPTYFMLVIVGGIAAGAFEVLYLSNQFLKRTLFQKILYKTSIYLLIITSFIITSSTLTNAAELNKSILDPEILNNVTIFVTSFAFISLTLFVASIIIVSLFYTEVSENLGQEVLSNFFTGKYHKPLQEARVFMFLDIKSSTTIAENIGHLKYFEMLKEYYDDLTNPVVEHNGEIYQYVGDEIIVSWKPQLGLKNNQCLNCFFSMKQALRVKKEQYLDKYGVVPVFKAGLHFGKVTTGEIGKIKKDIIFTGDVLNTTARIQGLCNTLNKEILLSEQLMEKLDLNGKYQFQSHGETALRGRDKKIELYSVLEDA